MSADRLRKLWAPLTDALAQRLNIEEVDHNPRNQRMVTSVLLLMAARSASTLGISGEQFARLAERATETCNATSGPRKATMAWIREGGLH